jgi:enoyl-CoA hydratase
MPFETIRYETQGPLAWIALNRPEKLNVINPVMVREIKAAMDRAQLDDAVRVIVLRGEGRAFSAGFDLAAPQPAELSTEEANEALREDRRNAFEMILRFWDSPKPTVAAVHTYCLGGAMALAMACDVTVASRDCRFGQPEVTFGRGVVALLLPYLCGPKRAKEILLTGADRITAEQAESWGLINRAVGNTNLLIRAEEAALAIAANDPLAVRITKQAINNSLEIGRMRDALKHALELDIAIETTETDDSREFNEILMEKGVKAAIEWRNRRMGKAGKVTGHEIG